MTEELEKEAEEWLLKNSGYSKNEFHGRKAIKAYIAGAETREKRIEELKEYLLQERETYWCKGFECGRKKQSEKLAEATKIIKELLDTQNRLDPYRDMFKDRVFKSEKFLKEVEK